MNWTCRATIFTIVALLTTQGFAESRQSDHVKKYRVASKTRTTKAKPAVYHAARRSSVVIEQDHDVHYNPDCNGGCAPHRCVCICPLKQLVGFVDRSLKAIFTLPCYDPCWGSRRRLTIQDCFRCGQPRHSVRRAGCAACGHEHGHEYYSPSLESMSPTPQPIEEDTPPIPPAASYRRSGKLVQPIAGKPSKRGVKTRIGPPPAHARRSTQHVRREAVRRSVRQASYSEPAPLNFRELVDTQSTASAKRAASRTPYRPVPRPTAKKKSGLRFLDN